MSYPIPETQNFNRSNKKSGRFALEQVKGLIQLLIH
jgi:hypothetical protein